MSKGILSTVLSLAALLFFCPAFFFAQATLTAPATAAQPQVEAPTAIALQPVLSGLSNTVYVTN